MSKKLKPKPKLSVAKRQPPKWQHERNLSLLVWIIMPVIIALAVGLVGYWGYDTYVAAWTQPIVKIGNETIVDETTGNMMRGNVTTFNMRDYVKWLKFYSQSASGNTDATTFPYDILQKMENNELVIRAAPAEGIQVTQDEVTAEINNEMISAATGGGNSTGNITGNITLPETDLGKIYQQVLKYTGLSNSEYRYYVEAGITVQKLSEQITQSVATEGKQAHIYVIQLDNFGNATEIENMLKNGGNFTTIAAEFSTDENSKQNGGDIGWRPQGILFPELDQAAFSLAAGNFSEPILASNGYYYIIQVTEIEENRPIEEQYRQMLASIAFNNWFKEQRNIVEIREYLDQAKATWAMNHIT